MFSAQQIKEITFEKSMRGYKVEDVNDLLIKLGDQVAQMEADYAKLKNEKSVAEADRYSLASEKTKLENEKAELDARINSLLADRQSFEAEKAALREEADALKAALAQAHEEKNAVIEKYEQEKSGETDDKQKFEAEKNSLERKLYILAEKLAEYRKDENNLKTALINAQRLGEQVIQEAKQKAETIVKDAAEKAQQLHQKAEDSLEMEKSALVRLQTEVAEFKSNVLELYKRHIESISTLPDMPAEDTSESVPVEENNQQAEALPDEKPSEVQTVISEICGEAEQTELSENTYENNESDNDDNLWDQEKTDSDFAYAVPSQEANAENNTLAESDTEQITDNSVYGETETDYTPSSEAYIGGYYESADNSYNNTENNGNTYYNEQSEENYSAFGGFNTDNSNETGTVETFF